MTPAETATRKDVLRAVTKVTVLFLRLGRGFLIPSVSCADTYPYHKGRLWGWRVGKTVTWDGETYTVYLGGKPGDAQYLMEVCPPYDGQQYELYKQTEGKHVTVGGKKYTNAISFWTNWWSRLPTSNVLFNLDGLYKTCTFEIGRIDGSAKEDATLNVYLDGNLEKTYNLSAETVKQKITINLKNALNMKLEFDEPMKDIQYAIFNATIE